MHDIELSSPISKKSWSIQLCCQEISPDVREVLPFVHAFTGCDTTSSIFGHGKPKLLKLMKGEHKTNIHLYLLNKPR